MAVAVVLGESTVLVAIRAGTKICEGEGEGEGEGEIDGYRS
jgi:hypothetical protein